MNDNKRPELWNGGPWEQPSRPVVTPVSIPAPRPVLRRRDRRRGSGWTPILCVLCVLLSLTVGLLLAYIRFGGDLYFFGFGDRYGYGNWYGPEGGWYDPYYPQDYFGEEGLDKSEPPAIPAAGTGSGFVLTLSPRTGEHLSYEEIYARCAPTLVSISARTEQGYQSGTGVVLSEEGYILTNAHIVANANQVEVTTADNRLAQASLVGFAAGEDLCVLKIDLPGLVPALFGDSEELVIGQEVAAIGDALGYRSTITDGIISSIDREVELEGITLTLLQTSAAINSGSSGGVLVDRSGHVVGITTAKIVTSDGSSESVGFAIPSARLKYVADRLIAGKEVVRGALGVTVNTLPVDRVGLEVLEVVEGSDARAKGITAGDVILKANGLDVTSTQVLTHLKLTLGAGDPITLTVQQGEAIFDLEIALMAAG